MEHIKITTTENNTDLSKLKIFNFMPMSEYWIGSFLVLPYVLKNMHLVEYKNKKCLTWYEKQQHHHDLIVGEFKNIFGWQKK